MLAGEMTGLPHLLLLALLLPVASIGPGLLVTRKLPWAAPERLCAAVGLSLILVFLAGWSIYSLGLPVESAWAVSGLSGLALAAARSELQAILRDQHARNLLIGQAVVLGWVFLLALTIRSYSGIMWAADWHEHYARSLFFLTRPDPLGETFLGIYSLTARPPLMNVLTAHFLAQVGTGFDAYQVVFTFLNALVFLPVALLSSLISRRSAAVIPLVTCLLLFNPCFAQNATYTWTKLNASFFALSAVYFYVLGWRNPEHGTRFVLSFVLLAAGILVHYSIAVYAAFMAAHYSWLTLLHWLKHRRAKPQLARHLLRTYGMVVSSSAALVATWFVWAVVTFGWAGTLLSNTTATGFAERSIATNSWKIGTNIFHTLVPHFLRSDVDMSAFEISTQANWYGWWRDYWFLPYQMNLITAIGLVGGLVATAFFIRQFQAFFQARRGSDSTLADDRQREILFWCAAVLFWVVLGIAVVGRPYEFGLAATCLQPVILLGVAVVAAVFPDLPRALRLAVVLGAGADFVLGIYLHFHVQSLELAFKTMQSVDNELRVFTNTGLSAGAAVNLTSKIFYDFFFLGDHLQDKRWLLALVLAAGALNFAILARMVRKRWS